MRISFCLMLSQSSLKVSSLFIYFSVLLLLLGESHNFVFHLPDLFLYTVQLLLD